MTGAHILVVEDDPATLASLVMLLDVKGHHTRGYPSAEALLADGETATANCMIVDLRLGNGMDGIELVAQLRRNGTRVPVIMLSGHGDIPQAVKALQTGVSDFLEKPVAPDRLATALERALSQVDPALDARRRVDRLSPRERDVFRHLMDGVPNKVVAARLSISSRTVETYRASIMNKMQLGSFAELVRVGLASGYF